MINRAVALASLGLASACGRISFDGVAADARAIDPQTVTLALDHYNPGAGFADFMLPVFLTSSRFDRSKLLPDASDLYFTDTTGVLLPSEIEQIGDGTDPLVAWVRIPDYNAGTIIQLHYGGPPHAPSLDPTWPASFLGVWHLVDGADSGPHANNGALHNTVAEAGIIGPARRFHPGDDDWVSIADSPTLTFPLNQLTMSGWVKPDSLPGVYAALLGRQQADTTLNDFNINVFTNVATGSISFSETTSHEVSGGTITTGTWHNIALTFDGAMETLYIDGALVGVEPETRIVSHSSNAVLIGGDRNDMAGTTPAGVADSDFVDGLIDEVRLENVARDAGWIQATVAAAHDMIISYP
ncbi:MAG TPA: LamG-like jellyroll fold domain-containing protein [Kofleriaceae bacterium]